MLSREGHIVYGTVRREVEPLPDVHYLRLDVRDREAVNEAVRQIVEKEGRMDVLVNNAGMGIGGPLEFASEEEARCFAPGALSGYLLRDLTDIPGESMGAFWEKTRLGRTYTAGDM